VETLVLAQIVEETRSGLETAWESTLEFLPKLGAFLLILIVGYIIAKVLSRILDRILDRVGFNRLVERGGVKTALDNTKYDAADILSRIVFWLIFLFVLQLAFGVFGPNPISTLLTGVIAFLPKLFVALVIIVITAAIATAVRDIIASALGGLNYGRILAIAAMVLIWFIGVSAALNQVEIAPEIVNGLFYAVLALIVGVVIVAIGGGGIQPMRQRWDRALNRAEQEAPQIKQQAQQGSVDMQQPAQAVPGTAPLQQTADQPPAQPRTQPMPPAQPGMPPAPPGPQPPPR
jgi:MFS family permease